MALLNKNMMEGHGPFVDFAYRETSVIDDDLQGRDIFFQFADDLIGDLCTLTGRHCPFDPYGFVNLMEKRKLFALAGEFMEWSAIITRVEREKLLKASSFHELHTSKNLAARAEHIRNDVLETLYFIIGKILQAIRENHVIVIVGI
jgi:hypothetical protein